jgi:hypothetical protein
MSKTKKGSKGPGYDYWSRRPGNTGSSGFGKTVKKITHAKERMKSKQSLLKEPSEPEYDPREYVPEDADLTPAAILDARMNMGDNVKIEDKHKKTNKL